MLRLQTTKPSNGGAFDLDDLVDDQSLKATTKKIVLDAKVSQNFSFFFVLLFNYFFNLAYTSFS
jgi:hypothetical protein